MPGQNGEQLFISDLHLTPEQPEIVDRFVRFLSGRARAAVELFILGDLFDAWIGDDDDTPPYPQIRAALRTLVDGGTGCHILHGNRDFLIGRAFARDTGCVLRREPAIIERGRERILLMHGDRLCTDDVAYQRFRQRIRNPLAKRIFLWRSLARRRAMAAEYRRRSGTAIATKSAAIMDVNHGAVVRAMRRHEATRLIHGHTHRPADHEIDLDGRQATRHVLADWHPDRGEMLVYDGRLWQREAV